MRSSNSKYCYSDARGGGGFSRNAAARHGDTNNLPFAFTARFCLARKRGDFFFLNCDLIFGAFRHYFFEEAKQRPKLVSGLLPHFFGTNGNENGNCSAV